MKPFTLDPLPYSYDNLEPVISKQIMELHHDKHHQAYVNAANAALEKLGKSRKGELEINTREVMRDLSFNANGAMLHQMFWNNTRSVRPDNTPEGKLLNKINEEFGSVENFKKEFTNAAVMVEGSGWAVLWKNDEGDISIGQLEKHNLLGLNGFKPLLVLDVWEHAYYLDYLNNRAEYVNKWWQIVNWADVEARL